jgi:hypothetical protein
LPNSVKLGHPIGIQWRTVAKRSVEIICLIAPLQMY